ncbi:hypothetical protein [Fodinicola feengrottensis]|uniref:hypothetical protein n=1 Tax=Fodinicola feengrottensis TaxID=435914 RepID=UPI0031DD5D94
MDAPFLVTTTVVDELMNTAADLREELRARLVRGRQHWEVRAVKLVQQRQPGAMSRSVSRAVVTGS